METWPCLLHPHRLRDPVHPSALGPSRPGPSSTAPPPPHFLPSTLCCLLRLSPVFTSTPTSAALLGPALGPAALGPPVMGIHVRSSQTPCPGPVSLIILVAPLRDSCDVQCPKHGGLTSPNAN